MVQLTVTALGPAAAALLALAGLVPPVTATAGTPHVLFRIADHRITEASGIAPGLVSPSVVYVQNDSGDVNRFFALDARTGATAATITVTGADNVDWEDIAVARDATGTPSVWLADIGDNDATRDEVRIYRVDEPRLRDGARGLRIRTKPADVWRLRYPGGAVDAESFAVTPDGIGYVVTKSFTGESVVYRVPRHRDSARVRPIRRVGAITFTSTGTRNPFGAVGELTATAAAISADGTRLAVRTYSDAYVWPLRGADVAAALRRKPTVIALPAQQQGEGIAFDGSRLLVDSERVRSPVYAVPLGGRPPPRTSAPSSAASAKGGSGSGPDWLLGGLAVAALVGAAAMGLAVRGSGGRTTGSDRDRPA